MLAILVYSILAGSNVVAVGVTTVRSSVLLVSGVAHLVIGFLHLARVVRPFRFEVLGHAWSRGSSLREAVLALGLGVLCLGMALTATRQGA